MNETEFEKDLNKVTYLGQIMESNITFQDMSNVNSRFDIMQRDVINAVDSTSINNSSKK